MDPLIYLFLAFLFLWGIVFIYLLKLFRRQKELLVEINRLQSALGEYQRHIANISPDQPPPQ